ncbi:hypothetical protein HPB48_018018 [Haemaphysalis longicornis]|uniref:Uncharacterized protein n=1 Tax=Haemaphysalis longicornis TaxID=44386 RepID=A0A9J6F853_HAELO|nr:hypothetical protein HPB48_018018 [Haemaphysalis longicornis]
MPVALRWQLVRPEKAEAAEVTRHGQLLYQSPGLTVPVLLLWAPNGWITFGLTTRPSQASKNSMVTLHLKSCYAVETQEGRLPPNAVTAEASCAYPCVSGAADELNRSSTTATGSSAGGENNAKRWVGVVLARVNAL